MTDYTIVTADVRDALRAMQPESVHCVVTSPPYWGGIRDYGSDGQLGLEREPERYSRVLVGALAGLRRVLAPDGTLWLNIGDVYAASGKGGGGTVGRSRIGWATIRERKGFRMPPPGFKMKDLTLVAFMVADGLRRDGWYLRSTIIWSKPTATEPMRLDRPAVSHEYLFLLSTSEHYRARNPGEPWWGRTVWSIRADSSSEHPATMPMELARRCIACSTEPGNTVLDPFCGSGTTGVVAIKHGRNFVGIELNEEYAEMASRRIGDAPLSLFAPTGGSDAA